MMPTMKMPHRGHHRRSVNRDLPDRRGVRLTERSCFYLPRPPCICVQFAAKSEEDCPIAIDFEALTHNLIESR